MDRVRIATCWLGGCSGCHMSLLDLDEFLVDLAGRVDYVFGPLVDQKEFPPGVGLTLVEGAVCNEDHLAMARRIRERSRLVVAFGDCAVTGNVSALRNQLGAGNAGQVLGRAYGELAEPPAEAPRFSAVVPPLLPRVLPLHRAIPVDFHLPGCPPPPGRIRAVLEAVLEGRPPVLEGSDMKFG